MGFVETWLHARDVYIASDAIHKHSYGHPSGCLRPRGQCYVEGDDLYTQAQWGLCLALSRSVVPNDHWGPVGARVELATALFTRAIISRQ